jgi:cytochrome c553
MRFLAISSALASTLLLTSALAQNPPRDLARFDASAADVERGRGIAVGTYNRGPGGACFQCHGIDGKGDGAAAFPRLTAQSYSYLYESMRDYASGVRQNAVMTPIAKALDDQQMRDVSAYYAAQQEAPFGPQPTVEVHVLQHGAALSAVGHAERALQACINCHGPHGVGLPPTYPYLAGQYANYLEAQLNAWKSGQRKSDRLVGQVMENIAKQMTDEVIRAVSAYYASIRLAGEPQRKADAIEPLPGPSTRYPER